MLRLTIRVVLCAYFVIDLVAAEASFTNPTGANLGTTYDLGQQIDISWQGAENFTALSLGLRQSATTNIFWIIGSPVGEYTTMGRDIVIIVLSFIDASSYRCFAPMSQFPTDSQ